MKALGGRVTLVDEAARARLARTPVVVLQGGRSSEREVSLWTGAAVTRALAAAPEPGEAPGPERVLTIEIEEGGAWSQAGRRRAPAELVAELGPRWLYFLALHGGEGEDGTIQGLLSGLGCAHTGSGVAASALCMDKHAARLVLREAGIAVAPGRRVQHAEWSAARAPVLAELAALSSSGFSVKPKRGGSSVSTFLLDGPAELAAAIEAVLATGDEALVEQRIRGSEATCGVLGNARGELLALPPVEIVPKGGRFFDYEEKYSAGGAQEFCPPQSLGAATCARLEALALQAFRAAGCDGYARVDFMIPRSSAGLEGEPVVLEINTLPGLTARSLLPQAAQAAGLGFRALCLELLGLALARPLARGGAP